MFSSTVTRLSVLLSCLIISSYAAPYPKDTLPPTDTLPPNNETTKWNSPEYKWIFENPLPIPPIKKPKLWVLEKTIGSSIPLLTNKNSTYTNNETGADIDYYEVEVVTIEKQVYPNLPATTLYTYDGVQPGPTFMMQKGRRKPEMIHSCKSALTSSPRGRGTIHQQQPNELVSPCPRPVQPRSL